MQAFSLSAQFAGESAIIVAAFTRYSFKHTNFILELLQLVQGNKWTDVKYNEV